MQPGDRQADQYPGGGLIISDSGRTVDFHGREPTTEELWALLASVPDPEIPAVSVVDLGIVRAISRQPDGWQVEVTPTYSGCPATELIESEIQAALQRAGVQGVRIKRKLFPTWTTDWITKNGRKKLKAYGIAPPVANSQLAGEERIVECPRCGSQHCKKISEFGSTACKALYQCESCLEPFDYFKCI